MNRSTKIEIVKAVTSSVISISVGYVTGNFIAAVTPANTNLAGRITTAVGAGFVGMVTGDMASKTVNDGIDGMVDTLDEIKRQRPNNDV